MVYARLLLILGTLTTLLIAFQNCGKAVAPAISGDTAISSVSTSPTVKCAVSVGGITTDNQGNAVANMKVSFSSTASDSSTVTPQNVVVQFIPYVNGVLHFSVPFSFGSSNPNGGSSLNKSSFLYSNLSHGLSIFLPPNLSGSSQQFGILAQFVDERNNVLCTASPNTNANSGLISEVSAGANPNLANYNNISSSDATTSATTEDVQGVCGSSNAKALSSLKMDSTLCSSGIFQNFNAGSTDAGPWSWQCIGTNATAVNCYANLVGACGNIAPSSTKPVNSTSSLLCNSGYPSAVTSTTSNGYVNWSWTCQGNNASGGASTPVNCTSQVIATCGSLKSSYTTPASNLCASGIASAVTGGTLSNGATLPWSWSCTGSQNNAVVSCQAIASAACGTNISASSSAPTGTLCSVGLATTPTQSQSSDGSTVWSWQCKGSDNVSITCASNTVGTCGTANGVAATSAPTANLCASGTASSVTSPASGSSGSFSWTCTGSAGDVASCSAVQNASCGSANGVTAISTPSSNLCNGGVATTPAGINASVLTWSCVGSSSTANCSAPVAGTCSSLVASVGTPTSGLCNSGVASSVTGGGSSNYTWTCSGNGGVSTTCSAVSQPSCGTGLGASNTAPSSGLCATGTAGSVSSPGATSSPWTWLCSGSQGTQTSCSSPSTGLPASGLHFTSTPSTNGLCSIGAVSNLTSTANGWTWVCTGSDGQGQNGSAGLDGSCNANKTACASGTTVTSWTNWPNSYTGLKCAGSGPNHLDDICSSTVDNSGL